METGLEAGGLRTPGNGQLGVIDVYNQQQKYGVHVLSDGEFWRELREYVYQGSYASDKAIAEKRDSLVRLLAAYAKLYRFIQDGDSKAAFLKGFAAGMGKLYPKFCDTVGSAEVVNALKRFFVLVRPHAGATRRDTALRAYVSHFGHHKPGGAKRQTAEMHQVPIGRRAIVGRVLAHGGNYDAVRQRQSTHGDRRKQRAGHCGNFLHGLGEIDNLAAGSLKCNPYRHWGLIAK